MKMYLNICFTTLVARENQDRIETLEISIVFLPRERTWRIAEKTSWNTIGYRAPNRRVRIQRVYRIHKRKKKNQNSITPAATVKLLVNQLPLCLLDIKFSKIANFPKIPWKVSVNFWVKRKPNSVTSSVHGPSCFGNIFGFFKFWILSSALNQFSWDVVKYCVQDMKSRAWYKKIMLTSLAEIEYSAKRHLGESLSTKMNFHSEFHTLLSMWQSHTSWGGLSHLPWCLKTLPRGSFWWECRPQTTGTAKAFLLGQGQAADLPPKGVPKWGRDLLSQVAEQQEGVRRLCRTKEAEKGLDSCFQV